MHCFFFILTFLLSITFNKSIPQIFLVGDSISIQYTSHLKDFIDGVAILDRKQDDGKALQNLDIPMGANGGDSGMVLRYLKSKLSEPGFKPDYMLLNCGLHDIKRDPKSNIVQIDANEYRNNLIAIFSLLEDKGIQTIWIRTTPVVDSIHNKTQMAFFRYNSDVLNYNKIADEVCSNLQIPEVDLYNFTMKLGVEQYADHVHFNQNTQMMQAAYIAGFIDNYLKVE